MIVQEIAELEHSPRVVRVLDEIAERYPTARDVEEHCLEIAWNVRRMPNVGRLTRLRVRRLLAFYLDVDIVALQPTRNDPGFCNTKGRKP